MRQRQTGRLRLQPLRRCWIFSANRKPRKPQEQHSHLSLALSFPVAHFVPIRLQF
jgi:hypothetical protein